jgi:hypothetical protein
MAANGRDPDVLFMRASATRGEDPYLRLHVEYQSVHAGGRAHSARALMEAVLRILALQKRMGHPQGMIDLGRRAVPWIDPPDNAPLAGVPAQQPFVPAALYDDFLAELDEPDRRVLEAAIAMLEGRARPYRHRATARGVVVVERGHRPP